MISPVWSLRPLAQPWAYINNFFNAQEIDCILDLGLSKELEDGTLDTKQLLVDSKYRSSKLNWILPEAKTEWIYRKITDAVNSVNQNYFGFDLYALEALQFSQYHSSNLGHYDKHIDIGPEPGYIRKLSLVAFLSDPSEFSGGELILHTNNQGFVVPQESGKLIFFPSYTLHEVTPVTAGVRYSLVCWVSGPRFR